MEKADMLQSSFWDVEGQEFSSGPRLLNGGREVQVSGFGLGTIIPKGTLKLNLRQDDQMDLSIRLHLQPTTLTLPDPRFRALEV